jgi:uncharacterized membrane protein
MGLGLVLPLLGWVRTSRLERELREAQLRLAQLENELRRGQGPQKPTEVAEPRADAPPPPSPSVASSPEVPAPPSPSISSLPASADMSATASPAPIVPALPPVPLPTGPPPLDSAAAAARDTAAPQDRSLEDAIGGRLMLWVGAIVLLIGVAFFLKYAFEHSWITEWMRIALGMAAGAVLVAGGLQFAARGYAVYGQIITGVGLAMLFLDIYAAFSFYALIGRTTAFFLLVLVTAGAATLADRQRSLGLALMAVGGGFATPFLVGGSTDAQVTLFTYDAVLVVGTLYLANRQDWPALNVLSFSLTWLTIGAWAATWYSPDKWLRTELFLLLFAVLFLSMLRAQVQRHGWTSTVSLVLALGPAIFHVWSVDILRAQDGVHLHVYLIAVTVAAVAIAARTGSTTLRMLAWAGVMLPLATWVDSHSSAIWLVPNVVCACAVFALHAWAQVDVVYRQQRPLSGIDALLQHVNGYALIGLLYASLAGVALATAPYAVLAVGVVHSALALQYRGADRRAALNALAVAFGALTVALAIRLDGPWLTVALAAEAVVLVAIGLRLPQRTYRAAGGGLLAVAVFRYAMLSLPQTPAVFTLVRDEAFVMGLAMAAACYAVAMMYRAWGRDLPPAPLPPRTLAALAGSMLVVIAATAENEIYWSLRGDVTADARFAGSLSLSVIWIVCACTFLGLGLWRQFAPLRYLAMALFGLSVLKVFLFDLSSLGGLYRILGFIGLGVTLLTVSFVYQRQRKEKED